MHSILENQRLESVTGSANGPRFHDHVTKNAELRPRAFRTRDPIEEPSNRESGQALEMMFARTKCGRKVAGRRLHIFNTTRNLASPLIMRSYASAARSSGYSSIFARTPDNALKRSVSAESAAVPDGHPFTR
jgi:hypothetical protein